jgi:hypothetical protein
MSEQDILDLVAHRQWLLLVGAILTMLVPFLRTVAAKAELTGTPDRVVSVIASYLQDLSWTIPLAGYDYWWAALLVSIRGPMFSGGLAELLAEGLKKLGKKPPAVVAGVLLVLATLLGGCAVHQAQVATQTSLTALAVAVDAGDDALVAAEPEIRAAAVTCARDACGAVQCPDPTVYIEDCSADADAAVDGLEVAAEALRVAQTAQDAWVASDQLPDAGPICEALGAAINAVPGLLDEAGVDVPPGLSGAGAVVTVICGVVARWAHGE